MLLLAVMAGWGGLRLVNYGIQLHPLVQTL